MRVSADIGGVPVDKLRLPGLSTAMASTVMRGYLLALSTQGVEQWTVNDNIQPMKDQDNFVITVGMPVFQPLLRLSRAVHASLKPCLALDVLVTVGAVDDCISTLFDSIICACISMPL